MAAGSLTICSSGLQMVQSRGFHGVGPGIRGPGDRLAGIGEEVFLGTVLPTALHVPARGIHQRSELGGAGSEQGDDFGQQSPQLHVPPRSVTIELLSKAISANLPVTMMMLQGRGIWIASSSLPKTDNRPRCNLDA